MGGQVIAGGGGRWSGAAIDSRAVAGGELFFALGGTRTDGHRFAGDALARGAAAAVVERPVEVPADGTVVRVPAVEPALHALTRAVRRRLPEKLVAVTGSAGKTTTKEMLATLLGRRLRVARSPGNLNNLLGFPLALLGVPEGPEWMVAEMGMSTPGELGRISRLGRPDVAVLLNVRPAHLESFADLDAVAEAKAELLDGLAPDGLVVANADDPRVVRVVERHPAPKAWFGLERREATTARSLEPLAGGAGWRFELVTASGSAVVELPLYGRHAVENFLAAAAAAGALRPAAGRGVVHRLAGEIVVVDDSYNSNPAALERALGGAAAIPGRRHWAVLGEMLELGPEGPAFHREAGRRAVAAGFSPVLGVGELARELVEAARGEGVDAGWAADAGAASERAVSELRSGDVVLVKGSRGVALETVVERLLAAAEGDG